jgi:histidyl-tRNA synthetase
MHQDNNEKKMVLRPEMTASIMRAYLEEKIQDMPWQVFEFGSTFRHERPQKGRYREFFQCSIELIGATSIGYDLYLISLLNELFKEIFYISFNLDINYISTREEREKYKVELYHYCLKQKDKFPVVVAEKLSLDSILRILDSKDLIVKDILLNAPRISDFWNFENKKEWQVICDGLAFLDIEYNHNEHLVRGLDYYNGLVFEFSSNGLGSQNAFCGGGRYDELAQNIDEKKSICALGAGIGIDRLMLLLEEKEIFSLKNKALIAILFVDIDPILFSYAIKLKKDLVKKFNNVQIYFDKDTLKAALKKANSDQASFVCLISKEQLNNQTVILKYMDNSKEQIELNYDDIANYIEVAINENFIKVF